MRILALTNLYPNPFQPHRAAFNRQQFRALAAEHEVQVIAPIAWTEEYSARHTSAGALQHLEPNRRRVSDGMIVRHPRYIFPPRVLRGRYGWFFTQSVRRCFHETVRALRPEVVLGCWAYPDGLAAVHLAREARLPVAVKVHGSDVLTLAAHPARRAGTIEALTSADAVITVSRDLGREVLAMGVNPSRVHTVYNGIDTGVFHPAPRNLARRHLGITSDEPLILFVGNLVPVKGLDVLLDALASLAQSRLRFQAALVGEGPLRRTLQSRIDALGLGARVQMRGACVQSELPHWYRAANLVVLPSRSEGVPNVLLEASACGTPWIASCVGGVPEIANPDSLFPPGDSTALANRVRTVLTCSGTAARATAFSPADWGESARELAGVLQGLVARSPRQIPVGV